MSEVNSRCNARTADGADDMYVYPRFGFASKPMNTYELSQLVMWAGEVAGFPPAQISSTSLRKVLMYGTILSGVLLFTLYLTKDSTLSAVKECDI